MKILVLGGSYFLGKAFVELAKSKHELTVFNRGSRPLLLEGVKEVHGDRHDRQALNLLKQDNYDAVVDFCAYEKQDISMIFEALDGDFRQYIYISTVDVYEHGTGILSDETATFEKRRFAGEIGAYISGKVALEEELRQNASQYQVAYTSLRPAVIYGPDNYAPREGIYIHWIKTAGQILHPVDATGEFQLVYVEDIARAVLASVGNEKAYNEAFNLAPDTIQTYESFSEALRLSRDIPFKKISVNIETILQKGIGLPFPLMKEESNLYNGKKALELIDYYTNLPDGLRKIQ